MDHRDFLTIKAHDTVVEQVKCNIGAFRGQLRAVACKFMAQAAEVAAISSDRVV
jgi:hypothetical protein